MSSNDTVICLYHDDPDGRCAAAIVRRALGPQAVLRAVNYGDELPWEELERAARVVIVDFSLPLAEMRRLLEQGELIWIDHHKTALQALAELHDVRGLRSLEQAGCVLTWHYFFPQQPIPAAVRYIGDRDVWRFAYAETGPFSEGLHQEDTDPANDALWRPLLEDDGQLLTRLLERGAVLREARLRAIEREIARRGFEITFEGHRTLAINQRGTGEMGEHIRRLGYEIAYCYFEAPQNGRLVTFVTLYSDQLDVSEIARRFGGGGHPGAAGFSFARREGPFPPEAEVHFPPKSTRQA